MGLVSASFPKEGPIAVLAGGQKVGRLVRDSFDRPNAASLGNADTGQSWVVDSGATGITGSKASPGDSGMVHISEVAADGVIEAIVRGTLSGAARSLPQLNFRFSDSNNYWQIRLNDGQLRLNKIEGGLFSTVASVAMTTTDNTDYELKAECRQNTIQCFVNKVLRITYDSTFNQNARGVGMAFYVEAGNTGARINDFQVRSLS